MITFPNAKINLGLNITARRPDGYHEIESIMIPTGWRDILEVVPSGSQHTSLRLSGRPIDCPPEKNLVMKALNALRERADFPAVYIFMRKIIPDGAGLGGGSADASFLLRSVNELFALDFSNEELAEVAATIGADCPFFIYNVAMLATGTGTTLTPVDVPRLAGRSLLIVKPPVHISTARAYAGVTPRPAEIPLTEAIRLPIEQWRETIRNDFELSLAGEFPMIEEIKAALYGAGALYASLSGSGSAIYGIFDDDNMAEQARMMFDEFDSYVGRFQQF